MKLLHLSDLHLGKRVKDFSMLEDQAYILAEILRITGEESPDAVLIAGDVYDKSVPSAEAVELFDDFLVRLARQGTQVFVISGNHDSPERMAFGGRLMDRSGIHLSPVYSGRVQPIPLTDPFGTVNIYMLPFLKPAHVRRFFPDSGISSYTDALRTAIGQMSVDASGRNVLVTHQFVTGAQRSESEEISIGGTDNVDAAVFDAFDYVALGHIHGPQHVGRETVRYCGTPLKYSFSEVCHRKSVTVVELEEKGKLNIRTVPLTPRRDMREIRGTYLELTAKSFYDSFPKDDYLRIVLTDEEDVLDAVSRLRVIYPNLLQLDYDNKRTRNSGTALEGADQIRRKSPLELFAEFYELQNGQPMSGEQSQFMRELIEEIWEAEA